MGAWKDWTDINLTRWLDIPSVRLAFHPKRAVPEVDKTTARGGGDVTSERTYVNVGDVGGTSRQRQ